MKQLTDVRNLMRERGIAALIVPGTDPHSSEYIAAHWQERSFISAFTGSAGTAVITLDGGCLWTDSRYFLQAAEQLKKSGLQLQKDGVIGTPDIATWLGSTLKNGDTVAVNPAMFSINGMRKLESQLAEYGISINTNYDFISDVWKERPALPDAPVMVFDEKYTGRSIGDKLAALRTEMGKLHIDTILLTALDDIAWLFNLRGSDIECNPVFISFAIVDSKKATLFINPAKLDDKTKAYLTESEVEWRGYGEIFTALKSLDGGVRIGLDFNKVNYALYKSIPCACQTVEIPPVVFRMKAIKNDVELAGERRAMVKDGVALVRFFMWLEKAVAKGEVTELSAIARLHECRAAQDKFVMESFGTIAGYAEHGAIVHYSSSPETDIPLKAENFFLLDSGGQYLDGTTDITRTVALGRLTQQQKRDYTLVLKGHIALATAKFPYGTRGSQLDILARNFLWQNAMNYGHGTGHGVGHFLNVHEGPQNIRMDENPTILEPGMVISNEPGIYRAGQYGIRTENLVAVREAGESEFGRFLCFETLTLFPFDAKSIDKKMLTDEEIRWINGYHKMVFKKLSPKLTKEETAWLEKKTREI